MKGQPLSYDRISRTQQFKRGWQSIECVFSVCVCVRGNAFVCVCVRARVNESEGGGRPVMSVRRCRRAGEQMSSEPEKKWVCGKRFTCTWLIDGDSWRRKTNIS